MNQTHIHLLITHLPIIGAILGGFVLLNYLYDERYAGNRKAIY